MPSTAKNDKSCALKMAWPHLEKLSKYDILQPMFNRYLATVSYIFFIVLINMLVVHLPGVAAFGQSFSPADIMIGLVYLVRDFAQREIKHYIFIAMFIGVALSYVLADQAIALASASAFLVGELIDWSVFTFIKKPLSKRLIWSAVLSSPFDSVVFLGVSGRLHWLPFVVMSVGKIIGVALLWCAWKIRDLRGANAITPAI